MTTKSPMDGLFRAKDGVREVEEGLKDSARESYSRYRAYAERIGASVTAATTRGTKAIDERLGDRPWELCGFDERRRKIARKAMTELVPTTLGERTTSFVDGIALKAGIGTAGLLLRLPLKPIAVPILAGLGVAEGFKVVRDIRNGMGDIARQVDEAGGDQPAG